MSKRRKILATVKIVKTGKGKTMLELQLSDETMQKECLEVSIRCLASAYKNLYGIPNKHEEPRT